MPEISVIMSVFNENENEIIQSVQSILKQTFDDFEFVIMYDNPGYDELWVLLEELSEQDDRIILMKNRENLGLPKSLNKALEISNGKYIARMDADDVASKDRLKKQYDFLAQNKDIGVVASDRLNIDENGTVIDTIHIVVNNHDIAKKAMNYYNIYAHPTLMFRREVIESVGGYRNFKAAQDYDLLLRLLIQNVNIYIINEPLLFYRVRNSSITQKNIAVQRAYQLYALKLYRNRGEYSEMDRENFFIKHHFYTSIQQENYNKAYKKYKESILEFKNGKKIAALNSILSAIYFHREILVFMIHSLIFHNIIRGYRWKTS